MRVIIEVHKCTHSSVSVLLILLITKSLNSFLHGGVPVILDRIICPPRNHLGNFSPFVAHAQMSIVYDPVLFFGPRGLLYVWIEMIVPPLSTLLADSTW